MSLKQDISALFNSKFGEQASIYGYAPGRVNLIGDHTDYNDGFVLPAAINFGTHVAAKLRNDNLVCVIAKDFDNASTTFDLADMQFNKQHMWVNYVTGTIQALAQKYTLPCGMNLVVAGNVPVGAGLSSSASFELALLNTIGKLYSLELGGVDAALIGQQAENDFVGCNCGIMDQLISAMGKQHHAMLLDCRSLTYEYAPIPSHHRIVIINSNVKRGLVDSAYNERRQQCENAANILGVKALRDVSTEQLYQHQNLLSEVEFKRAKHVVSENKRTENALVALRNNDIQTLSQLMAESHQSLKQDFEVSTPELDTLVDIVAQTVGNNGGVRMTGGGFGGCVVVLAAEADVEQVIAQVEQHYPAQTGLQADTYICSAENGAFYVTEDTL